MADSVTEFFNGQNIFITGGTGFLGKVLIEKLLRCCPNIGNLYLLMREKNGVSVEDRVNALINLSIFDKVSRENPQNLEKIVPVYGDTMKLNLGMSESDIEMLKENVSIVFYGAANVRFNESLKNAVTINTRGARECMLLAKKIKNLKVIVYVSTCYCQYDKKVVEEKLYPAPVDWRKFIEVAETVDEHILDILTPKITDNLPNTYVFSKALAENVVKDLGKDLPVVVIRPSIVCPAYKEPFSGWTDSLNGPLGFLIPAAKGLARVLLAINGKDVTLDTVPVDYVIKVMCLAAWKRVVFIPHERKGPEVYNVSSTEEMASTLRMISIYSHEIINKSPVDGVIWIPRGYVASSMLQFKFYFILTQFLPALIVDRLFTIKTTKPIKLVKLQRKIYLACIMLSYFIERSWTFKNDKMLDLAKLVADKNFGIHDIKEFDFKNYLHDCFIASSHIFLNTTPGTASAKKRIARMYLIENLMKIGLGFLGLWLLLSSDYVENITLFTQDIVKQVIY